MRNPVFYRITDYALLALAFAMPWAPKLLPVLIALVLLSMAPSLRFYRWQQLLKLQQWIVAVSALFFIWHFVSLFWTTDRAFGWFDLETKLSFILIPSVFALSQRSFITTRRFVLRAFVWGNALACLLCLGHAAYGYLALHQSANVFLDRSISPFIHLGYFSIYLVFAIAVVYDEGTRHPSAHRWLQNLWWLTIPLFVLLIFLTVSRMGMIVLLLTVLAIAVNWVLRTGRIRRAIVGIAVLFAAIALYVAVTPYAQNRLINIFKVAQDHQVNPKATESAAVRLMTWDASMHLIKQNFWIGVGSGDVKDELVAFYHQHHFAKAYNLDLNAHSQYLQTFAALGLPGILLLISLFVLLLIYAGTTRDFLLFVLTGGMIFACATESFLERQAGIVYFCLMFSMLVLFAKNRRL